MKAYQPIASYETADGAAAAATHLIENGYAEDEVGIEPHGFDVVRAPGAGPVIVRDLRRSALLGAAVAAALAALALVGRDVAADILGFAALGLLLGAVAGTVLGVIHAVRLRAQGPGTTAERLRPTRFDVVVSHDPMRGNHALARWWDPEARPAERRTAA